MAALGIKRRALNRHQRQHQATLPNRLDMLSPSWPFTQSTVFVCSPDQRVRIEDDHRAASH
jgi:hypothetical protein